MKPDQARSFGQTPSLINSPELELRHQIVPYVDLKVWVREDLETARGVVVYYVDCESATRLCSVLESTLAKAEQADVRRLVQAQHRQRMIITRGLLRQVLGIYLGQAAIDVQLVRDAAGRPRLASPEAARRFQVSCSRSGSHGAFAIAQHIGVGLDMEIASASRFPDRLAGEMLSLGEQAHFNEVPTKQRARWIARKWVCKEAMLKALGHGLHVDPKLASVEPAAKSVRSRTDLMEAFTVSGMPGWAGYLVEHGDRLTAVVAQGKQTPICCVDVVF